MYLIICILKNTFRRLVLNSRFILFYKYIHNNFVATKKEYSQ